MDLLMLWILRNVVRRNIPFDWNGTLHSIAHFKANEITFCALLIFTVWCSISFSIPYRSDTFEKLKHFNHFANNEINTNFSFVIRSSFVHLSTPESESARQKRAPCIGNFVCIFYSMSKKSWMYECVNEQHKKKGKNFMVLRLKVKWQC